MKLALLGVVWCFLAWAHASDSRQAIKLQYDRFAKAYVANDVETMLSVLAPDYRLIDASGRTVPRKEYEKTLRARRRKGTRTPTYEVTIRSFRQSGDRAEVTSEEVSLDAKGKRHVHRYNDSWRQSRGVWLLARSRSLGHGR
jgi:ketosteroid isomerase-like protein